MVLTSAVSPMAGLPFMGSSPVLPVEVLILPSLSGVTLVVVALLARLPVAPALILPVIFTSVVFPAGISLSAAAPVHEPDSTPSTLYCGFSI